MKMLKELITFIESHNGISDKTVLAKLVSEKFRCVKDRRVYYTDSFAIRFCKGKHSAKISNTVLGLSVLHKYDNKPFIVCICASEKNHLLLANTTMLSKISHSSQELRVDNIRGSFNASDILHNWGGIDNIPSNFEKLFSIHQNYSFEDNLIRLVEVTNNIIPTGKRFELCSDDKFSKVMQSPERAIKFSVSSDYTNLLTDLNARTKAYENEILVAALIENVNLRGRIIEYLIAGDDAAIREGLINYLLTGKEWSFKSTENKLGDYSKQYPKYYTKTDIKTKIMVLASAPKGYNIDKMLEFLSEENSVFMIYLVGIDYTQKSIKTKLISIFQDKLIDNTLIQKHWAGRNSRGVSQFNGDAVKQIILNEDNVIDVPKAKLFLERIIEL